MFTRFIQLSIRAILLALLFISFTPAGAMTALTLDDAVRIALENNPDLIAAIGRVDAAAGRTRQAALWSNPELILRAEEWPVRGGGFSKSKQTAGVEQTIPFPGKKGTDRRIGVSGVRISEAELAMARLGLVRDVKCAFYQVLATGRVVEVAGELAALAESSAAAARKRVAAGAAADQEQLRAEISLEQAKAELAGHRRELALARQNLALLLGRPDKAEVALSGRLAESADATLLNRKPESWMAAHPGVVAARSVRDRAELELRRARLEPLPDVKMGVAGGRIGETGESIVELDFAVPLPLIDRAQGRKDEARANLRIAEAGVASVEQRLRREWAVAEKRLRTAAEQAASYRERILPKADEALRLVRAGFEQGKFGLIDLLDTQRTTTEARLAWQQKLLELNIAQAELEALLQAQVRQLSTNK